MKISHRYSLALCIGLLLATRSLFATQAASAQPAASAATAPTPAPAPAPAAAPVVATPAAAPDVQAANEPASDELSVAQQLKTMQDRLDAQQAELTAMRAQLAEHDEDAQTQAALESLGAQEQDLSEYAKPETVSIYGYMDFGLQRIFAPKSNPIRNLVLSDESSFVVGNLNLYFDVSPAADWRGLTEVRFTSLPHGQETLGVPGGTPYSRVDSTALNQTSPDGRDEVLIGGVVIERAWAQWQRYPAFNVRVGQWFTPFGIWNVDHGSPVLITLLQPDFQISQAFPSRQTGVMVVGDLPMGGLTLGYSAYVSNGRTLTLFDFSDDKALGGRLTLLRPGGDMMQAGVSAYYGTSQDQTKTLASVMPFRVDRTTTIDLTEYVLGVDYSIDLGALRFRTEGVMRHVQYEPGKHAPAHNGPPSSIEPNHYYFSGYVLAGYTLPWLGLEPTASLEGIHRPSSFGNSLVSFAPGVNVHFEPTVQLKNVAGYVLFIDAPNGAGSRADTYMWVVQSRLVVAF